MNCYSRVILFRDDSPVSIMRERDAGKIAEAFDRLVSAGNIKAATRLITARKWQTTDALKYNQMVDQPRTA